MTRITSILLAVGLLAGCGGGTSTSTPTPAPAPEATPEAIRHAALFKQLPAAPERDQAQIDLGRMLYFEPRLSKNHDIACASCHKLDAFGVDNEPTSPGHKGLRGGRNSPTTLNASLHIAQFWDGRAANLTEQAKGPILNPVEMAMADEAQVLSVLSSIPGYVEAFAKAFPNTNPPMTYQTMARAIATFEEGLLTPSKFDNYLGGDASALSDAEKAGMDLFVETGCTACHAGVAVGGAMYQKLGLVKPYATEDIGRQAVTDNEAERFFFKVPSLRNIAKTGPYFHDGSIATLEEAVKLMGTHQLGKELTDDQVSSIVTFLGALTGELDKAYAAKPELPASGPTTPKPDPS